MPTDQTTERYDCSSFVKAQFLKELHQVEKFFEDSEEELNLSPESFVQDYKKPLSLWVGTWCEVPQCSDRPTETAREMSAKKVPFVQLDGMGGFTAEIREIWLWTDSEGNNWINEDLFN